MKRKQVENMAEKIGMSLRETDAMQRAENEGCRWAIGPPGWVPTHFFKNLEDAYDYLAIEKGGQLSE
jgi:hypothetical protein